MSYPPNEPQSYPPPGPGTGPEPGPGQPPYGAPGPGQPSPYGAPGYGSPEYGPPPGMPAAYGGPVIRRNPIAGLLLILGGLAGIAVGVIPPDGSERIAIVDAFDFLTGGVAGDFAGTAKLWAIAYLACVIGGLIALIAGFRMFRRARHTGAATAALVAAILQIGAAVVLIVATDSAIFDNDDLGAWLLLFSGIPTLIGAIVGFARK